MRKLTFWLTLFLIFSIPWEDTISLSIGTGTSLTRVFGLGVAGFWMLTILMEGRFRKPHLFHALVVFFFIWSILSYLWSLDIEATNYRVKTYAQIFLLMLIMWEMLQNNDDLMAGLQAFIFGSFIPIISTIMNYLRGVSAAKWEVRFAATGVNAVDMALFLLLGLPIAWHLFTHPIKNNRILKIINLAYLPLALFAVLLTASRTSLFALVPALIFIVWPKRLTAGRILIMAILLVVTFAVFQALLPAAVLDRLSSVATSISSADIGGRVDLWAEAVGVFSQHPYFGSGSGTLSVLIGTFAHETFLSVLAETGLIGFIFFGLVLIFIITEIFRLPKGYLGLWLSTFMVWFIGILSLSFEFRKITWLFFSFMVIQGYNLREQWQSKEKDLEISEVEEVSALGLAPESKVFQTYQGEDGGLV